MNLVQKIKDISWWKWVIGIDIFLILATVIRTYIVLFPNFPFPKILGKILALFNLAGEMNFAAWWTGICLLAGALLAYELFCIKTDRTRTAWLNISIVFVALSWDEIGSLHERLFLGSWFNYLPYGLAILGLLIYALIKLFPRQETKKSALFILFAFILFASVAFQEYLEHALNWALWLQPIRFGIEEGIELAGVFLCLLGTVIQRKNYYPSQSLSQIIPNPFLMRNLSPILLSGLLIHGFASIFTVLNLTDIPQRGNPAVLYPTSLFFLVFCASVWKAKNAINPQQHQYWDLISSYFLVCSAFTVCSIFEKFSKAAGEVNTSTSWFTLFSDFYFWYSLQLFIIISLLIYVIKKNIPVSRTDVIVSSILTFLLSIGLIARNSGIEVEFLILGVFCYLITAQICLLSQPQSTIEQFAKISTSQ